MIGRRLGRFLIQSELGRGGMGVVWRAKDELLNRCVALKLLTPELATAPKIRRRFLREAKNFARLDHPAIVTVFDYGEAEGYAYIALALVEGENVSQLVSSRLLPIGAAVRIVKTAACAIAHAHEREILHRDVTSRNIMVARDGRVFVLDFGLSRAKWESRLTTSEGPMGTVAYMAPEALKGAADERSDLYGLGVVLYEALTGALPHTGPHRQAVEYHTVNEPPIPLRERRPEIPEALETIVLKAIAREPADRFQTALEFIGALEAMDLGHDDWTPGATSIGLHAHPPVDENARTRPILPDPAYLAFAAFTVEGDDPDGVCEDLARRLPVALSRAFEGRDHVIVLECTRPIPDALTDLRALAGQLGANVLLGGRIECRDTRVTVFYRVVDARTAKELCAASVERSVFRPLDLEAAVIDSVRGELGWDDGTAPRTPRTLRDPAAQDRYQQALGNLRRHDNEGALDAAIGILERLLATEGEDARYRAALVRACIHKAQLTQERSWESRAASECERAVALSSDLPETWLAVGSVQLAAGNWDMALNAFGRAPGFLEADLGMARALAELGRADEAENVAKRAVSEHERDWRAHSMMGWVSMRAGHYPAALEQCKRAVELTPDNVRALRNLGHAYFNLDCFEEAAETYRRSITVQPHEDGYSNLGTVLYYLNRDDEAVEAFRKATALAPSNPYWWGNLGNACRWIPGHEEESRRALDNAIALIRGKLDRNPAVAEWWARLAGWLMNRERADEAIFAIERAIELDASDPQCILEAVRVYYTVGDRGRCFQWLRRAHDRGVRLREFSSSRELAPLRSDPEFRALFEDIPTAAAQKGGVTTSTSLVGAGTSARKAGQTPR